MGYRAIALSQVDGAGGESIGHDLAERLSFGYLNEAIISRVARDYGVTTAAVAEAERRKSFLSRVAEMAALGSMAGVVPDAAPYIFDETDALLSMIREAVRDAAARGERGLLRVRGRTGRASRVRHRPALGAGRTSGC